MELPTLTYPQFEVLDYVNECGHRYADLAASHPEEMKMLHDGGFVEDTPGGLAGLTDAGERLYAAEHYRRYPDSLKP